MLRFLLLAITVTPCQGQNAPTAGDCKPGRGGGYAEFEATCPHAPGGSNHYENDGACDVPTHCSSGTDCNDCVGSGMNSCECGEGNMWTDDGACDVPSLCGQLTDCSDCHNNCGVGQQCYDCPPGRYQATGYADIGATCPPGGSNHYDNDGACDVPTHCARGTDCNDCSATMQHCKPGHTCEACPAGQYQSTAKSTSCIG